jgi:hypothetical protein
MIVRFCNIKWDTDGRSAKSLKLPSTVTVEIDDDCDIEEEGADLLSDQYGWCIRSLNYKVLLK